MLSCALVDYQDLSLYTVIWHDQALCVQFILQMLFLVLSTNLHLSSRLLTILGLIGLIWIIVWMWILGNRFIFWAEEYSYDWGNVSLRWIEKKRFSGLLSRDWLVCFKVNQHRRYYEMRDCVHVFLWLCSMFGGKTWDIYCLHRYYKAA